MHPPHTAETPSPPRDALNAIHSAVATLAGASRLLARAGYSLPSATARVCSRELEHAAREGNTWAGFADAVELAARDLRQTAMIFAACLGQEALAERMRHLSVAIEPDATGRIEPDQTDADMESCLPVGYAGT